MSSVIVPVSYDVVNADSSVQFFSSGVENPGYDPMGFSRSKSLVVHEFPDSIECFLDVASPTWGDIAPQDVAFLLDRSASRAARGQGDVAKNAVRNSRRAKTQLRRKCKMIRANCMITLTYRALVTDRAVVQADFKAFRKRLATLGEFHYVAALEVQERGSLHLHIACQSFPAWLNVGGVRVKSFNVLRAMWHRVVGRGNGSCNVRVPRGSNSPHRIASYIGKYVAKSFGESALNEKSYWSSAGIPRPVVSRRWVPGEVHAHDLITELATGWFAEGYTEVSQYYSVEGGFYWFSVSRPH